MEYFFHLVNKSYIFYVVFCCCLNWIQAIDAELLKMESRRLWESESSHWAQTLLFHLQIYQYIPLCSVSLLLSCPFFLLNTQCMHIHIYKWNIQAWVAHKQFKAGSLNKQNNLLQAYKLQALPARPAMHLQYTANILYERNPCNGA